MAFQTKKISEWLQERPTSNAFDALSRDGSIALLATAAQGAKADTAVQPEDIADYPAVVEAVDTLQQLVSKQVLPEVIAGVSDKDGLATWMLARYDGAPHDWSMTQLRRRLLEQNPLNEIIPIPGVFYSIIDVNGLPTDLTIRDDGQLSDFVIERIARRIGGVDERPRGILTSLDRWQVGDALLPVIPDMSAISGWGSSSMEMMGAPLAAMASGVGASFYNGGKGGEQTTQIAARLGAIPALLTVSGGAIPASGSVTVTSSNMLTNSSLKPFTGWLGGVFGTLSSTNSAITFTRQTAGSAVPIDADTPFIPQVGPEYRNRPMLLNMGKNDLTAGVSAQVVIDNTDACFDWLSPMVKRCLVLGHFVNTYTPEVSTVRDRILEVNAAYLDRYGELYVDLQEYITGMQVWEDVGIVPTTEDLQQQAIGNLPPSLGADSGHFSSAAYQATVAHLITPKVAIWYGD